MERNKFKPGDIVEVDSGYLDNLTRTLVCHKYIKATKKLLCGEELVPNMSHEEWEKVTCIACKGLKHVM